MKEIIVWDEKYLTGIEIIDQQHKKIFNNVNNLFNALENLEKKEKILELIKSVDFYATEHFNNEEKYMIEFEYPEYPAHKAAHMRFRSTYEEIRNSYIYQKDQAVYVQAIHLSHILADWLDYHLQHEDQELANFLRSKL